MILYREKMDGFIRRKGMVFYVELVFYLRNRIRELCWQIVILSVPFWVYLMLFKLKEASNCEIYALHVYHV